MTAISQVNPVDLDPLWKEYISSRSDDVKRKLVERYFPFVQKVAIKVSESLGWKVSSDDLSSFGVDGLYTAIEKYEPERGKRFETYAGQRIKGAMIDGLRREDEIPRSVHVVNERFERHKQRMQNYLGRQLTDSEFVHLLGMDEKEFHKNHRRYIPIANASLEGCADQETHEEIKQDSNINLRDPEAASPIGRVARKEFLAKLLSKNFSDVEKKIVYLYYYESLTMEKVAKAVSLSESRVSQMHKQILVRLRKVVKSNPKFFGDDVFRYISNCNDHNPLA